MREADATRRPVSVTSSLSPLPILSAALSVGLQPRLAESTLASIHADLQDSLLPELSRLEAALGAQEERAVEERAGDAAAEARIAIQIADTAAEAEKETGGAAAEEGALPPE